jgi:hypothetical protein
MRYPAAPDGVEPIASHGLGRQRALSESYQGKGILNYPLL